MLVCQSSKEGVPWKKGLVLLKSKTTAKCFSLKHPLMQYKCFVFYKRLCIQGWDLIKINMFYSFIKNTPKWNWHCLNCKSLSVKNTVTPSAVRGHCLDWCYGITAFTCCCFYIVSAHVSSEKGSILVSLWKWFDLVDFFGFVNRTLRIAGRDGHPHYWIDVVALPPPRKKRESNPSRIFNYNGEGEGTNTYDFTIIYSHLRLLTAL